MLKAMVTLLHRCGICRLNLAPANIRLVHAGNRTSRQGSDHGEDHTRSELSGSQAVSDSISRAIMDLARSVEPENGQAADNEQHLEVISLVGSTRWCRHGELLDMQGLKTLLDRIRVSWFFTPTEVA